MWQWIKDHPMEVAVIGVAVLLLAGFIWWQSKSQRIFNTSLPG